MLKSYGFIVGALCEDCSAATDGFGAGAATPERGEANCSRGKHEGKARAVAPGSSIIRHERVPGSVGSPGALTCF